MLEYLQTNQLSKKLHLVFLATFALLFDLLLFLELLCYSGLAQRLTLAALVGLCIEGRLQGSVPTHANHNLLPKLRNKEIRRRRIFALGQQRKRCGCRMYKLSTSVRSPVSGSWVVSGPWAQCWLWCANHQPTSQASSPVLGYDERFEPAVWWGKQNKKVQELVISFDHVSRHNRAVLIRYWYQISVRYHPPPKKNNNKISDFNALIKIESIVLHHFCPKRIRHCGWHSTTAGGDITVLILLFFVGVTSLDASFLTLHPTK